MGNRNGDLFTHNLWSFWESIPIVKRELIITQFESGAALWGYKSLFEGIDKEGGNEHGDIHMLDLLLNVTDLELCDIFFDKFRIYKPGEYLNYSFWGSKWYDRVSRMREWAIQRDRVENIKIYDKLTPEHIYWKDAHYFISNYAKHVYKLYLDGICNIDRFALAFSFEFDNSKVINEAVRTLLEINVGNGVFEQYLIYLEKEKKYQTCIDLMNNEKLSIWKNNFEKRISRCQLKLDKSTGNGNKS
jgi:hypothetical protein